MVQIKVYFSVCIAILFVACQPNEQQARDSGSTLKPTEARSIDVDTQAAARYMWQTLARTIEDTIVECKNLQKSVENFLQAPTPEQLISTQNQWHKTHDALNQASFLIALTKAYPQLLPNSTFNPGYRLTAKPIQPGYLDRFGPYPFSGLVHDIGTKLHSKALLRQHGLTDNEEVVLGIYAIEFMLFGEQSSRSAADYIAFDSLENIHIEQGLESATEIPNNRRRTLLALQVQQLHTDIQQLQPYASTKTAKNMPDIWQQLSATKQLHIARSAHENVLAQTLIALVDLQTLLTEKEGTLPPTQEDKARQIRNVRTLFEATHAGNRYFGKVEQASRQQTAELLEQHLQHLLTSKQGMPTEEDHQQTLSLLFTAIKSHL